ncbi:MAG TPA: glycosyltransferase [Thermoanaerobaculia bacterium]
MRPLVSVIVPSYNHARFVATALGSIEAQSWRPLEVIVVDDGSSDGSQQLLRTLVPRLNVDRAELIEQPNQGAHNAIMRGIEAARGEYLAIVNSDDYFHPERLAVLLPRLVDGASQLAFSGVEFVDAAGARLPFESTWPSWYRGCFDATSSSPTLGFALLAQNFSVSSGNFVFSRELYEKLSGFSSHRFCHDWDFLMRSIHFAEPAFERRALLSYRIHESNTTETVRDLLKTEATEALQRYITLTRRDIPPNTLAPCESNWPDSFARIAQRCLSPFSPDETLLDLWTRAAKSVVA